MKMSDRQQIILPWRDPDCVYRRKHFDFLFDYYSQEFDIVIGDNEGKFNRSAARNSGVDKSTSEISVIIDADNYIPISQIHSAIKVAKRKDSLIKPFSHFGYLTEEATNSFYVGKNNFKHNADSFINSPEKNFTGGAYVIKKSLWQKVGGMDEGFIGWGAEDDAFHILIKAKLGNAHYVDGFDYHLYHPAHRVTSEFNYNKLMEEYVNGNFTS
jgi:predicted glycosyltransferase involved in capsule biosynthesis